MVKNMDANGTLSTKSKNLNIEQMTDAEFDALQDVVMETFDAVAAIEDELTMLERERTVEEAKLDLKYDILKAPLMLKRNAQLERVPMFWLTAMENHRVLKVLMEEKDRAVLAHLRSVHVERTAGDYKTYKIVFRFAEDCTELVDKTLVKEVTQTGDDDNVGDNVGEDGDEAAGFRFSTTEPQWTAEAQAVMQVPGEDSFFDYFTDNGADAVDISNILLSDFLPNVLSYYQGAAGEDDDEEMMSMMGGGGCGDSACQDAACGEEQSE